MNKSDLKSGMRLTARNGAQFIYFSNPDVEGRDLIGLIGGFIKLSSYNDDLTHNKPYQNSKNYDVVKIESSRYDIAFLFSAPEKVEWETIWKREEPKEYVFTEAEKLLIKAYALIGFKYWARDWNGVVYVYEQKPSKFDDDWKASNFIHKCILGFDFTTLSWSDTEPYEYKGEF
jgi:hypothetical protein